MGPRSLPLSLVLLGIGLVFVVAGVFTLLHKGVEIGYSTYTIMIPEYSFETLMPGSYTRTESYSIELASIKRDTSERVSWVYRTVDLPWRNCTGANFIGVGFEARIAAFYNGTPRLVLEIYGCRGGACETLVSSDLLTDAITIRELNKYIGKTEYMLPNDILHYEYFNTTLTPVGLVVENFLAASHVTCTFRFEVTAPALVVRGFRYIPHFISIPSSVDTYWLRAGMALSIAGLAVMVASLYAFVARKASHRPCHAGA